jgi:hypothetical protein
MDVRRLVKLDGCRLCGHNLVRKQGTVVYLCAACDARIAEGTRVFFAEVRDSTLAYFEPTGVVWELTDEEFLERMPGFSPANNRFMLIPPQFVERLKLLPAPPA